MLGFAGFGPANALGFGGVVCRPIIKQALLPNEKLNNPAIHFTLNNNLQIAVATRIIIIDIEFISECLQMFDKNLN